jgi:hypothetical protein
MTSKMNPGARISDESVQKATGKIWKEWFSILDKAGKKKMNHKDLVQFLKDNYDVSMWWQQSIVVQYELARGLREPHQKPDGYQISRSKTISASPENLYSAFEKLNIRKKWLKDVDITITSANPPKSLRGKWLNDKILIDVAFYEKSPDKTQVVVQNNKVKSANEAEKLKKYWENSLIKLDTLFGNKG